MIVTVKAKTIISIILIIVLIFGLAGAGYMSNPDAVAVSTSSTGNKYIKWVDFNVPYSALNKALNIDINSHNSKFQIHWVEVLAYLAAKYGGNFSRYKAKDMDALVNRLKKGEKIENITKNMKLYKFYNEAYSAVLGGFVGTYDTVSSDGNLRTKYGLKVFSPIAKGYSFGHYDDFGNQRTFGFSRKHLGNDLLGNVGTPIVAVETGIVEVMGWNIYGGWRIGIRSLDMKRYYYYAHLRKDRPFHSDLYEGKVVKAGEVIGYMGMTGYSTKENVNNIRKPHLHFGLQLIFDESQKDGVNQIWVDVYNLVDLLNKNRASVTKAATTKDYNSQYNQKSAG